MTDDERRLAAKLAIGRLFRLGSRPAQPGDIAEYHACRAVILDAAGVELAPRQTLPPNPGWNFGSGTSGCIE